MQDSLLLTVLASLVLVFVPCFLFYMLWQSEARVYRLFKNYKFYRLKRKMQDNAYLYDSAVKHFEAGNRELGEKDLQKYSQKTGVTWVVKNYTLNEDGFLDEQEPDVFYPGAEIDSRKYYE